MDEENTTQHYEPEVQHYLAEEDSEKAREEEHLRLYPLVADIKAKFEASKSSRDRDEQRWLKAFYNYRGVYHESYKFTKSEKSKVFVKVTKTKTLAAYGQIMDVLFAQGRIPLSIEPTEVPEGIEDDVHVDLRDPKGGGTPGAPESPEVPDLIGYPGDGKDFKPGETLADRVGAWLSKTFKGAKWKPEAGSSRKHVTFHPAQRSAKKMEARILDQLHESQATTHLRRAAFECVLMGTGILKGPFAEDKEYPNWDETGNYTPTVKTVPKVEHVSLWDFYPDPEARNMHEVDWTIQRHKMTSSQVRGLKRRPFFRSEAINQVIADGPNWVREHWESYLNENNDDSAPNRFEVLEYWGMVERDFLEDHEVDIPEELDAYDEFQANVWISGDRLLRVVLNPFTPAKIPYHMFPYEENPYSIFGVGVPENMEDTQTLMNGFTRLAVDNAVLSGNLIFEVDETNLVPGQDMKLEPGKIFRRQGGAPGQAIFATKFPNVSNELMGMFDRFRQMADESTGMPSYSHGQTGVTSTNRTAAGVSMLMGAAALNIRTVVKNIDDYLLKPLGESFYHFNMQFLPDPEIKGDLEIKSRGTSALMQREVKSQRLIQFLQVASNPITAPMTNYREILKEIAHSMDLDSDKVVLDEKAAMLQAQLLGIAGQKMQPENQAQQGQGDNPAGAPQPSDPSQTGGGNIGSPGAPASPGEAGFSASNSPGGPMSANATQQQQPGGMA